MRDFRCVEIPPEMQHLEKDKRGYPIPVMVLRDRQSKPIFTANSEEVRLQLIANDRCGICGKALYRGRWFTGGPMSAFDVNGAYFDPPMHANCMRYAMMVCPYIALPSYKPRENAGAEKALDKADIAAAVDLTQIPGAPAVFVSVMACGQKWHPHGHTSVAKPKRPYRHIEFWKHGVLLDQVEGTRLALMALEVPRGPIQGPKLFTALDRALAKS